MSAEDGILAATRVIIERVVGDGRTPLGISLDTPLADGFWMDSVELLEVIVACEQEFGIAFDDASDLDWDGLQTLGALVALIAAKVAVGQQNG